MKIDPKDKVKAPKACTEGKHTFIPAHWRVSPNGRDCTLMVCQHCLMTIDKAERERLAMNHHEELEAKASN